MRLELHPLDPISKKRLNDLLISDGFERWVQTIRAEFEYEVHQAKVDFVALLADPQIRSLDKSQFQAAARLRVALDVIEEFSNTSKEHQHLTIV